MLCSTYWKPECESSHREVIGICSKCQGHVVLYKNCMSLESQVPTCEKCGAKKKRNLPVVEME